MKTNKSLLQFRWPPNPRTTCSTISNNSQQIFTRSLLGFFAFRVSSFFRGFYYFFQSCLITLPHPHAVTCTVRHVSFRRGQKRAVWGRLAPEARDYCCATTILVIRALLSTFTGGRRKKKKVCAASSVMPPRRSRPRSSYDITSHFRVVYLSCLCLSCWRRDER